MLNAYIFPLRISPFCSLGEVGGAGRAAPQRLTIPAAVVKPILPYNEADGSGAGLNKSCSPFSAAKWYGKNSDCQGFKGGDFPRKILPVP